MKKIIPIMAAIITVFAAHSAFAINVSVNGVKVNFTADDGYPFAENGHTLVPLRAACEAFGAQVSWDAANNQAVIVKDGVTVTAPLGDNHVYRNGEAITNEVATQAKDGRTYLPIRVVMEAFDAQVGWDGASETVTVNDPDAVYIQGLDKKVAGKNEINRALALIDMGRACMKSGEFHNAALCYKHSSDFWWSSDTEAARYYLDLSDSADADIRLFLKTDDPAYDRSTYYGAPFEPKDAVLLGTTYNSDTDALSDFKHNLILQYFDYGVEFSSQDSWFFKPLRQNNTVLEVAWQPKDGLDMVNDADYVIRQAQYLQNCGVKILLRFANEMNDETSSWYTPDYNKYIEKYRFVANIFRQYAPDVALVWAPNFYPPDTVDLYYPGDDVVDYVGLSVYQEYVPTKDPFDPEGPGVERGRWPDVFKRVYDTYSWKKPIIMAEGGCSYVSPFTGQDVSDFAVTQMGLFYTYLPILYPNVKMAVLFNTVDWGGRMFFLKERPALAEAYKNGIHSSGRYIGDISQTPAPEYYYELHNNFSVPAGPVELCSYITSPAVVYDYVTYTINGVDYNSYGMPYTVPFDFSAYSGQTLEVRVRAFANNQCCADETTKVQVR